MRVFKNYLYCLLFMACEIVTSVREFGSELEEGQQRKTYFKKEVLVYGSQMFEIMSQYPAHERNVEFLFGNTLSKDSPYLQVEDQKLHIKKIGQEKVTVRIFHNHQLADEIQTLLRVLPRKLTLRLRNRTAGLEELTVIPLTSEFVGLNLKLQAQPAKGIKFYSYQPDTETWQENHGSFFCEKFSDRACSFAIKANEAKTYSISVVANDKNIVFEPPLKFSYTVGFSYPFFKLNDNNKLQSLHPRLINIDEDAVFSYTPALEGLSIDEKTGELRFRTLAHFAAAGGQSISVAAAGKTTIVDLKIEASNREELKNLIYIFINEPDIGSTGNYNAIDTSQVEDMSSLFFNGSSKEHDVLKSFNGRVDAWDTSRVIDMSEMFRELKVFNQNISHWNTENVSNMSHMFFEAEAFNQNIGRWDTKNVSNMSHMFWGAKTFNQDIGRWDTESVNNMSSMFYKARDFNQNIGNWQTESVKNMQAMFAHTKFFNQDIRNWNTENVKNMSSMFFDAQAFNGDIGYWNTGNVVDMSWMFAHTVVFDQEIGSWNTQNVNNMSWMFFHAKMFNQNIGSWNTENVSNMYRMFKGAEVFNQNIGSWNTSKVTNMVEMFNNETVFNQDISAWDVQAAKNHQRFRHYGFWENGLEAIFGGATAFNKHNANGSETFPEDYFKTIN